MMVHAISLGGTLSSLILLEKVCRLERSLKNEGGTMKPREQVARSLETVGI